MYTVGSQSLKKIMEIVWGLKFKVLWPQYLQTNEIDEQEGMTVFMTDCQIET